METSMKLYFSLFMNINRQYLSLVHDKRELTHHLNNLKHVVTHVTHSV